MQANNDRPAIDRWTGGGGAVSLEIGLNNESVQL